MAVFVATAGVDAVMDYCEPDLNKGSYVFVAHEAFYGVESKLAMFRGIGDFDVSELAGLTLNGAVLVRDMYSISSGPRNAKVSRCTRAGSWTEGGVTWNKYDGVNAWTAGGGDFDDVGPPAVIEFAEPATVGWHRLGGLLPFVTDALENRGGIVSLITRLSDEDPGETTWFSWHSKDYGSCVWYLEVDYVRPAGHRSYRVSWEAGGVARRPRRPAREREARRPRRERMG